MAEVASMPPSTNGNGYAPHYGSIEQNGHAYNHNSNIPAAYNNNNSQSQQSAPTATPATPDIPKDEVGWYFVEQYYTTLSRSPEKLYLFYNKRSQFVSGQETDKVQVCVGQRAINDRIKALDFHDCKVRVTNVDSQASDVNIVIQVIGEISNKSQPHKKFTQTFVLATQTNGYFVLNDIFRYLIEEEDEQPQQAPPPQQEEEQQTDSTSAPLTEAEVRDLPTVQDPESHVPATTTTKTEQAEPKTLTSSMDPIEVERDAKTVDNAIEDKVLKSSEPSTPAAPTNGVSASDPLEADATAEDSKKPAEEAATEEPEVEQTAPAQTDLAEETPKDPEPTPAASPPKQAPAQPAATAKPSAPKTWASLAASAARVATPAVPAAAPRPAPKSTPTSAPKEQAAPQPQQPKAEESAPAPASTPAQQDEWTAVGSTHNRAPPRSQQQPQHQQQQQQQEAGPQNRGYIKNVHDHIDAAELRAHLEQFGEITYFDIARQKVRFPTSPSAFAQRARQC